MNRPVRKTIYSERYERFRYLLIMERKRTGMTQTQLADALGRPQSFVSKYETGERRLDVEEFLLIAEALKIDAPDLITRLQSEPHED